MEGTLFVRNDFRGRRENHVTMNVTRFSLDSWCFRGDRIGQDRNPDLANEVENNLLSATAGGFVRFVNDDLWE